MRAHSIEKRYALKPSRASIAMSSAQRWYWSHASPEGSTYGEPGVCSSTQKSELTLLPSTWCAAVAVPHWKLSGKVKRLVAIVVYLQGQKIAVGSANGAAAPTYL